MIKFFRKIRQKLLSENKLSKYLLYALGEIILVVIGILIAIQLNTWRNEHNDDLKRTDILKALEQEFKINLVQLDSCIYYGNLVQKANTDLNELIKRPSREYTEDEIALMVGKLSYLWSFNPTNGALQSAVTSGDIHLISNKRLVELLFNWEGLVEDSYEEFNRMEKYQFDNAVLLAQYIRNFDAYSLVNEFLEPSDFTSDYESLFRDPLFEDYKTGSSFYAYEYTRELSILREHNTELLALILNEINN